MTPAGKLRSLRIIVAEDEYFIAVDVVGHLEAAGAHVVGVRGTVAGMRTLVEEAGRVDVAVLDINLDGETIYTLADELIAGGVSLVFTTGYDRSTIPPGYAVIECCEKPVAATDLVAAVSRAAANCRPGRKVRRAEPAAVALSC